jgi:hypothetical protein
VLKQSSAGVAAMAACRALDVLMGSGASGAARALPAATVVGAHTAVTTAVSRNEVAGAGPRVGLLALAATGAVAAAAGVVAARQKPSTAATLACGGLVGAYLATVGDAQARAACDPSPARLQRAVGAGILGLMPLEGALVAGSGALAPAVGVAGLWPLARALARRRAVT